MTEQDFADEVPPGCCTTYVLVQNPNDTPAEVTLTEMTGSGPVRQWPFAMGPRSRMTVDATGTIPAKDFSVKVTATRPVVAERAICWNGRSAGTCTVGGYAD